MSNFIFPKQKICFIHIPRTGGSTIRDKVIDGPRRRFFGDIPNLYKSWFSFAFIRQPIDRFYSAYRYCSKRFPMSINEFAEITLDESIGFRDLEDREEWCRHHSLPMTHPFNCLHLADYVGRFDNYEQELRHIGKRGKFKVDRIPKTNGTAIDFEEDFMEASLRKRIQEFYSGDFEVYYCDYKKQYEEFYENGGYGKIDSYQIVKCQDRIKDFIERTESKNLLDFGCGDPQQYERLHLDRYWKVENPACYDPAIPELSILPREKKDVVICIDVMEHIPEWEEDKIVRTIFSKAAKGVFFHIATNPAQSLLPNKQNPHCNLKSHKEWVDLILHHRPEGVSVRIETWGGKYEATEL